MTRRIGIYGFKFTKQIYISNFTLTPIYNIQDKADTIATDKKSLRLTGIGEIVGAIESNYLFDLEAVLTFIQQQFVMLDTRDRPKDDYPEIIPIIRKRGSLGDLIMNDSFKPESTRKLIHTLLKYLSDENFCKKTGFREAFFRNVEIHKLFRPVIDLSYYLSFSGMELLARNISDDFVTKNVSQVISSFLRGLEFEINQEEFEEYAHVRNALFHHGKYETEINKNGEIKIYKLIDYETKLETLFCDALLKAVKFDDGTINWNRWQDRQPFTC